MLLSTIDTLDAVLVSNTEVLGRDFVPYRNHTYRVANFCVSLAAIDAAQIDKVAIAAAFHDLGIWTAGTFDYLAPSIQLAGSWLEQHGRSAWFAEIEAMILEHHKVMPYRRNAAWLVEPFRRADWTDVSRGAMGWGVKRHVIREAYARWPGAGFHRRLIQLSLARARTHPLSPLPMVRF
jgi:predicted metal-dependent HD superfamily phosphohydrolase